MKSQLHKPSILFLSYDEHRENLQRYVLEVSDKFRDYEVLAFDDAEQFPKMSVQEIAEKIDLLIQQCNAVVVLAGGNSNKPDKAWSTLSVINRMNYEIRQALDKHKYIIAVLLQPNGVVPIELKYIDTVVWIHQFSTEQIADALEAIPI